MKRTVSITFTYLERTISGGQDRYVLEVLDTLPVTRLVSIFVLRPSARVRDPHRLDRHGIRALVVVRHTACPLDRPVRIFRVATGPDTQTQVHRRLREILASVRVGVH